jgi:prevent-host-death family protein
MESRCQLTANGKKPQRKSANCETRSAPDSPGLERDGAQHIGPSQRLDTMVDQLDQLSVSARQWITERTMPTKPAHKPKKRRTKPVQVNLYEAKTHLSSLVERAANGEEIVIAKAGKPMARLSPVSEPGNNSEPEPLPFGKNLLGITYIADDFDDPLPPELFEEGESDYLFRPEAKN